MQFSVLSLFDCDRRMAVITEPTKQPTQINRCEQLGDGFLFTFVAVRYKMITTLRYLNILINSSRLRRFMLDAK